MIKCWILVWAGLMLCVTAEVRAESDEKFDPLKIPKEQFAEQIDTIALRRPILPWDTENEDAVAALIESQITERLRDRGYRVLESAEYDRVWQLLSQRAGGGFDPVTGKSNDKKLEVIRNHTGRELERLHGADAVLVSWISFSGARPGSISSTGQVALWEDGVTFRGAPLMQEPQLLIASHIALGIYDINGVELYTGETALEWTKVYVARSYEAKPAQNMYPKGRVQHAVKMILEPLVARCGPGS